MSFHSYSVWHNPGSWQYVRRALVIEYRHGNSPVFSNIKMPGLKKTSNVSLKKGVFKADNRLFDWFNKMCIRDSDDISS